MSAFNDEGKPVVYYDAQTDKYLRVLCTAEDIRAKVHQMADQIVDNFQNREEPLLLLNVLEGGSPLTALLVAALSERGLQFEYNNIKAKSADGTQLKPSFDWHSSSPEEVHGKHVLLIDDVLSSGGTLSLVRHELLTAGAIAVDAAILVDGKKEFPFKDRYKHTPPHQENYKGSQHYYCTGIDSDSLILVYGAGIDMQGKYRDLPCIVAAFDEAEKAASIKVGPITGK